jgi:hypothetical protein
MGQGFLSNCLFQLFRLIPMSNPKPNSFRVAVSDRNQIQVPAVLVEEIGSQSRQVQAIDGAFAVWYYHEQDHKAVLGHSSIQRESLEVVTPVSLQGLDDEELERGDVYSTRVTIPQGLPSDLYQALTSSNRSESPEVILRPIYAENNYELDGTCVSVYPADLYEQGELPNVDQKTGIDSERGEESSTNQRSVGNHSRHKNSV